ncbi:MAG: hypothetical protein IAF00_04715, partial [Phycisphaerales bacterium]|nr:hypothetical protein [Phycisphaerales bacterium]
HGTRQTLSIPAGDDEIARIGATLVDLVGDLQQEKQRLALLNAKNAERIL